MCYAAKKSQTQYSVQVNVRFFFSQAMHYMKYLHSCTTCFRLTFCQGKQVHISGRLSYFCQDVQIKQQRWPEKCLPMLCDPWRCFSGKRNQSSMMSKCKSSLHYILLVFVSILNPHCGQPQGSTAQGSGDNSSVGIAVQSHGDADTVTPSNGAIRSEDQNSR